MYNFVVPSRECIFCQGRANIMSRKVVKCRQLYVRQIWNISYQHCEESTLWICKHEEATYSRKQFTGHITLIFSQILNSKVKYVVGVGIWVVHVRFQLDTRLRLISTLRWRNFVWRFLIWGKSVSRNLALRYHREYYEHIFIESTSIWVAHSIQEGKFTEGNKVDAGEP